MVEYENECVDCPKDKGCLGNHCPKRNVPHYYCDNCGDETDLYYYDGQEICIDCIKKQLEKVEA